MMRAVGFNVQRGGLSRLRVRGGASAQTAYDLVDCYVTNEGTVVPRDGTIRDTTLPSTTRGLTAFGSILHTFSHQLELYTPIGYIANVLAYPDTENDPDSRTISKIHFAEPFMGALYVVAEWDDGTIAHYWLASSGEWEADHIYMDGDVVTPTTPNGLLYKAVAAPRDDTFTPDPDDQFDPTKLPVWQSRRNYSVGDRVLPSEANGYYFQVTDTQGDVPFSGFAEPNWNASEGAETTESSDSTGAPGLDTLEGSAPAVPPDIADRYGTGSTQLSQETVDAAALADTVGVWAPGTTYQPGSLVKPRSAAPVINSAIPNSGFEDGDTGWSKDLGWSITNTVGSGRADRPYQGAYYATWQESVGLGGVWRYLSMSTTVPVLPGQFVSASCYEARNGGSNSAYDFALVMLWYDDYDVLVKETESDISSTDKAKDYRIFTVQDTTPGGATKLRVAAKAKGTNSGGKGAVDSFTWDYVNLTPVQADYTTYQATQSGAGTSGPNEPIWPGPGNTVVDGSVTWEGGINSVITWTAFPIMKSGSSEPDWGDQPGSSTLDNTISWVATTGYVDQAPASKVVALAAKKVFAGDNDIVKYSATVNPLDWTTEDDAGYLPTGINTYGANPVAVLALYRSNLMSFNGNGFQMWQVDPDPENMAILDAVPVGSTYHRSMQAVKNDLIFLTILGVRSIGIAGGSVNLQAGDIGEQIDSLVIAELRAGTYEPKSIYFPARGQYWLWFGPQVFVCTFNDAGPSWSRYVFPEVLTDATILGESLYLRTETDKVWLVSEEALADDMSEPGASDGEDFSGVIWWPALDLGNPGQHKQMDAFDVVMRGRAAFQLGYDQRDPSVLTDAYTIDGDTLPGMAIPYAVSAPSFAPKLVFEPRQSWEWLAFNIYLQDDNGAGYAG